MIYGDHGFVERFSLCGGYNPDEFAEFFGLIDSSDDLAVIQGKKQDRVLIMAGDKPAIIFQFPPCKMATLKNLPEEFYTDIRPYMHTISEAIHNMDFICHTLKKLARNEYE